MPHRPRIIPYLGWGFPPAAFPFAFWSQFQGLMASAGQFRRFDGPIEFNCDPPSSHLHFALV